MKLQLISDQGKILKEWKDVDRDVCEFTIMMMEPSLDEDIALSIQKLKDKKEMSWMEKELKKSKGRRRSHSPRVSAKVSSKSHGDGPPLRFA